MLFNDTSLVLRGVAMRVEVDFVFSQFTFEWGEKSELTIRQAEKHIYKQTETKNAVGVDTKWFS